MTTLRAAWFLTLAPLVFPVAAASSEAPFYFALAQAYSQEGAYQEAFESFTRAVELDPSEPFLRMEFAEFLMRLGRLDAAAEQAAAAHRLAPKSVDALRLHAHIQRRKAGDDPAAMLRAQRAFEQLHLADPDDVETTAVLARIYLTEGRLERAATVLEETLESTRHPALLSLLFDVLSQGGAALKAEQRMRRHLAEHPDYVDGWLALANHISDQGRHGEAVEILTEIQSKGNAGIGAQRSLAIELYRLGDLERALAETDRVLAQAPQDLQAKFLRAAVLTSMGSKDEAEGELRDLLNEPGLRSQAASLLSELLEQSGRVDEAAAMLRQTADKLRQDNLAERATQLLLQLVDLKTRTGDWSAVLELTRELEKGRQAGPDEELGLLRAQALIELDRPGEALKTLDKLTSTASSRRARATRAEVLHALQREDEAVTELRGLAQSDELEDLLAAAEAFHRLELYAEAIPVLERADKVDPGSNQVLFWLGAAYERDGQGEPAESTFRRLLGVDPEFAPALNYLGYMWAERGENLEEALELVQRAVALDPDNGAYLDSLGWAYFQLGRYDEARGHLERAAELTGNDPVVLEHLGDFYLAIGEAESARENYRRALELDAENASQVRSKLESLDG